MFSLNLYNLISLLLNLHYLSFLKIGNYIFVTKYYDKMSSQYINDHVFVLSEGEGLLAARGAQNFVALQVNGLQFHETV
jgi:hypothetical protein